MNALRHVTYRAKEPWISEDDLVLTKTLGQRVSYVRGNLVDKAGKEMTQREFAKATGLSDGHHGVMHWEKGTREPKAASQKKISELAVGANYRPGAFSRRGAEALVVESAVPRLQALEGRAVGAVLTFQAVLAALAANGIQVQLPQEAVGFLATGTSTTQANP